MGTATVTAAQSVGINFEQWLFDERKKRDERPSMYPVPEVLRSGLLTTLFQPIVDLTTHEVFAQECLVRSTSPHFGGPPALFEEAIHAGLCGFLGRSIRHLAVRGCQRWPLFLNIHPQEFDDGCLVQPDDPMYSHTQPIYIEITESVPLARYSHCKNTLAEMKSRGVKIAIDDLGAGYSNLKYIADLAPEIVKLDRVLSFELATNKRVQKLVRGIVRLCVSMGADVVIEGIETPDLLKAAADTGARYGQGFAIAHPGYPPAGFSPRD